MNWGCHSGKLQRYDLLGGSLLEFGKLVGAEGAKYFDEFSFVRFSRFLGGEEPILELGFRVWVESAKNHDKKFHTDKQRHHRIDKEAKRRKRSMRFIEIEVIHVS